MGVILAIAFGAASSNGGWASLGAPASLLLATLTALGLWLWGRQRAPFAADTAGGGDSSTPDLVQRLAPGLAWRLRARAGAAFPPGGLVYPSASPPRPVPPPPQGPDPPHRPAH